MALVLIMAYPQCAKSNDGTIHYQLCNYPVDPSVAALTSFINSDPACEKGRGLV